MEDAHWPTAYLGGAEFHHIARAVNLGSLWAAFDIDVDERLKRMKITRRAFDAHKVQGLEFVTRNWCAAVCRSGEYQQGLGNIR